MKPKITLYTGLKLKPELPKFNFTIPEPEEPKSTGKVCELPKKMPNNKNALF